MFLVTSLTQGPSPPISPFGRVAGSMKSPGCTKITEANVFLGTFNAAESFFRSLPQICALIQSYI